MTVIALGWKEMLGKNIAKVLYCGEDMDEALKVIQKAGKEKSIRSGEILRGIEDRVIRRIVFDA